jgi:hypothetical protein
MVLSHFVLRFLLNLFGDLILMRLAVPQEKTCYDTHLPMRNTNLKLTIHYNRYYYTNRLTIDVYYRRILMILLTSDGRG